MDLFRRQNTWWAGYGITLLALSSYDLAHPEGFPRVWVYLARPLAWPPAPGRERKQVPIPVAGTNDFVKDGMDYFLVFGAKWPLSQRSPGNKRHGRT